MICSDSGCFGNGIGPRSYYTVSQFQVPRANGRHTRDSEKTGKEITKPGDCWRSCVPTAILGWDTFEQIRATPDGYDAPRHGLPHHLRLMKGASDEILRRPVPRPGQIARPCHEDSYATRMYPGQRSQRLLVARSAECEPDKPYFTCDDEKLAVPHFEEHSRSALPSYWVFDEQYGEHRYAVSRCS